MASRASRWGVGWAARPLWRAAPPEGGDSPPPRRPGSLPPARRRRSRTPEDPAFERWLDRQLHDAYDRVLNEPVPDELLELLEGLPARGPKGDDSGGEG